jgi:hypothetical protein
MAAAISKPDPPKADRNSKQIRIIERRKLQNRTLLRILPFENLGIVSDWKARPLLHPRYGVLRISSFDGDMPTRASDFEFLNACLLGRPVCNMA